MGRIRTKIGPNSPTGKLRLVDKRTRLGRLMTAVQDQLTDELGRPTPQQQLIISTAAMRVARLQLLGEQMMAEEVCPFEAERRWNWHANGLRKDLSVLGLGERHAEPPKDLKAYIEGKAVP